MKHLPSPFPRKKQARACAIQSVFEYSTRSVPPYANRIGGCRRCDQQLQQNANLVIAVGYLTGGRCSGTAGSVPSEVYTQPLNPPSAGIQPRTQQCGEGDTLLSSPPPRTTASSSTAGVCVCASVCVAGPGAAPVATALHGNRTPPTGHEHNNSTRVQTDM